MLSRIAGILLRTHLRERFDESSDVPDRRLFMCAPERRHAAHLDAVVDDPVYLLKAPALSRMGERGRLGPHGLGPSGARGADASVAVSRSEEHTSEIHTLMRTSYAGFGLKKK